MLFVELITVALLHYIDHHYHHHSDLEPSCNPADYAPSVNTTTGYRFPKNPPRLPRCSGCSAKQAAPRRCAMRLVIKVEH